jgi:hypothetical protein
VLPGLASGLALAVRPAGVVEAPGSTARRRRVPLAGCKAPLRLEGPTRTMRGVPPQPLRPSRLRRSSCETVGLVLADGCGSGSIRRAPHAAGHRGRRARQLGTPGGLPPKGRDESCRTVYGELPGSNLGRDGRATLAAHPSRLGRAHCSRFTSRPSGLDRRRCALETCRGSCHSIGSRRISPLADGSTDRSL